MEILIAGFQDLIPVITKDKACLPALSIDVKLALVQEAHEHYVHGVCLLELGDCNTEILESFLIQESFPNILVASEFKIPCECKFPFCSVYTRVQVENLKILGVTLLKLLDQLPAGCRRVITSLNSLDVISRQKSFQNDFQNLVIALKDCRETHPFYRHLPEQSNIGIVILCCLLKGIVVFGFRQSKRCGCAGHDYFLLPPKLGLEEVVGELGRLVDPDPDLLNPPNPDDPVEPVLD